MGISKRHAIWPIIFFALILACNEESAGLTPTELESPARPDAQTNPDAGPPQVDANIADRIPRIESGLYSMGVALAEFGGLEVAFQVEIEATVREDGTQVFEHFYVRAVSNSGVSEPLADSGPVEVTEFGTFVAQSGDTVMPAAYSPTGSDVRLRLDFLGRIVSSDFVCGQVVGEILTLETALEDSAFGLEPWIDRSPIPPAYCEAQDGGAGCPRMETAMCPELVDGLNEGFVSCEVGRTFEVHLPSNHDPEQNWPVLYVFHGLGGSHVGMAEYSGLLELIDELGVILVVPSSTRLPVEWEQFTLRDNLDLAWFDDTLNCMHDQLGVDLNRVYISGMSAGGLYASYLGLMRSTVVAASAPMSGGLIINFPPTERPTPMMFSWGGVEDFAVEQNFDVFARNFIDDLKIGNHFVIACDHGGGHVWDRTANRAMWQFFMDHPLDVEGQPYADGLPDDFPDYCSIVD